MDAYDEKLRAVALAGLAPFVDVAAMSALVAMYDLAFCAGEAAQIKKTLANHIAIYEVKNDAN